MTLVKIESRNGGLETFYYPLQDKLIKKLMNSYEIFFLDICLQIWSMAIQNFISKHVNYVWSTRVEQLFSTYT
jgi:hypothetical protein